MNTPYPTVGSKYKDYDEAKASFNRSDLDESIKQAKYNLTDKSLPPFFVIKNYRLSTEQTYLTTLNKAKRKNDQESLAVLAKIRIKLNELAEFRFEDLTGLSREEMNNMVDDNMDIDKEGLDLALAEQEMENTAGMDFKNDEKVTKAEAEILLPFRISDTVSPPNQTKQSPPVVQPTKNDPPPHTKTKKLRPKKSIKFSKSIKLTPSLGSKKGGAYHAQQFSKSTTANKPRKSVLDVDWTPKNSQEDKK